MAEKNLFVTVNNQKYQREYIFGETVVLNLSTDSFIADFDDRRVEDRINGRINMQLLDFTRYAGKELFNLAVDSFKDAEKNNYPFRTFEAVLNYTVTNNQNNFLSAYRDNYEYTGGAHGATVRKSDTWSLFSGRLLPLSFFFPKNADYSVMILECVLLQAEKNITQNPGIYFDEYPELIIKNFNPENYYLTPDGVIIYYQQYEIAPYASGIPEFLIPYESLKDGCPYKE